MELSQQQLVEVLERLESAAEPTEVRRTPRIAIRRHVILLANADNREDEKAVVLQDISRGGISLTYHEAMPPGRRFILRLPAKDQAIELLCVVRNCQMIKQHLFRIGAEFDSTDSKGSAEH